MKEKTFLYILGMLSLVILFTLASMVGIQREKTKQIYLQKHYESPQIKRAILDLIQEVNTLNMRQLELRYEIEQGGYDRDLFYIEAPKIYIGNCTNCHFDYVSPCGKCHTLKQQKGFTLWQKATHPSHDVYYQYKVVE